MSEESSTPFSKQRVLVLGATGYIGGEILFKLLKLPEFRNFEISTITRSSESASELSKLTQNRVNTIIGSLDDSSLLEEHLSNSDVVINAADVDNVNVGKSIAKIASKVEHPFLILHTSGTSVLGDELSATKGPSDKVYSDLKDNEEITNLPETQPHRPVDKIILSIQDSNPKWVKTVLISPPTIFGLNEGYIHRESVQIPLLIELSIKNKQAFTTYSGDYKWSHVHVDDLADLYIILLRNLLINGGKDIKTGKEGYYFAEVGVHYWKDISSRIARLLKEHKVLDNDSLAQLEPKDIRKLADGFEFAPLLWGTNAVSKAELGREYGWEPKFTTADLLHDIEASVDRAVERLGN